MKNYVSLDSRAHDLSADDLRQEWRQLLRRVRRGDDIHITSDKRRALLVRVDSELCRLRLEQATALKEVE